MLILILLYFNINCSIFIFAQTFYFYLVNDWSNTLVIKLCGSYWLHFLGYWLYSFNPVPNLIPNLAQDMCKLTYSNLNLCYFLCLQEFLEIQPPLRWVVTNQPFIFGNRVVPPGIGYLSSLPTGIAFNGKWNFSSL